MKQERKCPKSPEVIELEKMYEPMFQRWSSRSLDENIVDHSTVEEFIQKDENILEINKILIQHELFEAENFGELYRLATDLADKNKMIPNIDYKGLNLPDPFSDNYHTLSLDGWRRHILNLVYAIRSDYKTFVGYQDDYKKWLKIYGIFCSGADPDGLTTDLQDLGY